jgi:hypothetical protein
MTSIILSDQQKDALYTLGFSIEQIKCLNEKPELAVEIARHHFLLFRLNPEKIISLALTKSSIFSDINALLYCGFSRQDILALLQIDESGELLRSCVNYVRRFQDQGILSQIGHEQIIKLVSEQYSLGATNNAPQEDSKQSLLLQTTSSLPQQHFVLNTQFDEIITDLENYLRDEIQMAPIPQSLLVFSQSTAKEWLAASGYNNQQIAYLVNHPSGETFITALKNLHHQLITKFTHEQIVFIINNKGIGALESLVKLCECGFNKQIVERLIIAPVNLYKLERLSKHAPMLLKQQFTEEDLLYLLLEHKEEFIFEHLTEAHPFLTKVLGFSMRQVKLLAKSPSYLETWNDLQNNYLSLIAFGITKKELSQLGAQRGREIVLVLLKHHMQLFQLGFSPKDMFAIAKHMTGVQNIKAVLDHCHTTQEPSFTNSDLIKITDRNCGYNKLSALSLYYKTLQIDFSHEEIVDLASLAVADIETIAQFGYILRTMNFTPCQILEIAKLKVTEYLNSIVDNYAFLHVYNFQPNELYALAKISNGNNTINKIKQYYENIHHYKFPFSKENLVTLLTGGNEFKVLETINKYQNKLCAWGFKSEELLGNFVYKHSCAYLDIIILRHNELQQLGFKKNHLIPLASKSQAVFLLKSAFDYVKSFQEQQLLHTISIEQVIEKLVLNSEKKDLRAISGPKASRKRKIDEVTKPVQNYEESRITRNNELFRTKRTGIGLNQNLLFKPPAPQKNSIPATVKSSGINLDKTKT